MYRSGHQDRAPKQRCSLCASRLPQGMVAVVDPKTSWCAKWTHLRHFVPGCYALAAPTALPQHIEVKSLLRTVAASGSRWQPF